MLGLSEAIAAGAVICGAYFGDKMTPLSETTILVPKLVGGGLTVGEHVRNMFWTAGPAIGISLVIFLVLGLTAVPEGEASPQAAVDALESSFNIIRGRPDPVAAPHPVLREKGAAISRHRRVRTLRRDPGCFTQRASVEAFVGDPALGPVGTSHPCHLRRDGDGLRQHDRGSSGG